KLAASTNDPAMRRRLLIAGLEASEGFDEVDFFRGQLAALEAAESVVIVDQERTSQEKPMRRTSPPGRAMIGLVLPLSALAVMPAFGAPPRDESATIVYRDDFGIPHVYAPTLEDAAFGIGYAQAEDRLEELLKNYRRAAGTMAEVFGPGFYQDDLA